MQLSFIPKCYFFHLDHPPFSWADSGNFHPPPSLHQESCHGRYFAEHACSLKASPQEGLIELWLHLWPKYAASQSDCLSRQRAHLGSSGCVSLKITHITLESHLVRQGSGSPESRDRGILFLLSAFYSISYCSWVAKTWRVLFQVLKRLNPGSSVRAFFWGWGGVTTVVIAMLLRQFLLITIEFLIQILMNS